MAELKEADPKNPIKSQTIQGNILSIIATVGGVYSLYRGGVPIEVFVTGVTTAGGAIWGNIMSIFGRLKATTTVGKPKEKK